MIKSDFEKFAMSQGISTFTLDSVANNSYINPMIIEERTMNMTSIDVYSRLQMDRIIFLNGQVESDMANILTAQLLWLDQQSDKPISMYINSPGGSVIDGLQLIDTMNFINAPIYTTCLGLAASMGAVILSCGEKGKRFALPHSRIMLHQASGGYSGKAEDVKTSYEQLMRCQKDIFEILSNNLNKPYDEIEQLCSNTDKWFIGPEAIDLGIIDSIVKKNA